jgi:hypothetical protein
MKHHILNGLGIGFFVAIFLSMYLKEFFNLIIPIYIVYGIIAPLLSAIFIFIFITLDERERKRAERELYEGFK